MAEPSPLLRRLHELEERVEVLERVLQAYIFTESGIQEDDQGVDATWGFAQDGFNIEIAMAGRPDAEDWQRIDDREREMLSRASAFIGQARPARRDEPDTSD